MGFLEVEDYSPPEWARDLTLVPKQRYVLGMLPTPMHRWRVPGVPEGVELWIKRDDLSGMQMSGNKVRKLEYLMAAAVAGGHDCVITIGGIQSNHARATAVAARYLGLDSHLILRTSRVAADQDPGLTGNLLVDRLVGAHIHQVTKEEYAEHGGMELGRRLQRQLEAQGHKPYLIPVGGSNALGTWGYLQATEEIQQQLAAGAGPSGGFSDIVMACGSGATTAGLALGSHLSGMNARVTGYGVCDSEDYFYDYVQELLEGLGAGPSILGADVRKLLHMVNAKGAGYAVSIDAELQTVRDVAVATGIVLDPVYSGKALHYLLQDMQRAPQDWAGRRLLFIHTGGLLGMYDKEAQLQGMVEGLGRVHRMVV